MKLIKLKSNKGFTMVELLIVLAIIAILAAVAIPIYSSQLENSRIKVDESNLRAATGLAAQDYIVRYDSGGGSKSPHDKTPGTGVRYRVMALKDNSASGNKISSENMLVLPTHGYIHRTNGEFRETQPTGTGSSDWVPLYQSINSGDPKTEGAPSMPNNSNKAILGKNERNTALPNATINGKQIILFPIQQNSGNGFFDIVISTNGVVTKSRIVQTNP